MCKHICLLDTMMQVQVRVPENLLEVLDKWIKEGKFKSRSDAIRIVLTQYEEREKSRGFYKLLNTRSLFNINFYFCYLLTIKVINGKS